jgi:hypothetical protein
LEEGECEMKIGRYKTGLVLQKLAKYKQRTLFDIEGGKIAVCCGTCDCCFPYDCSKEFTEFPYNLTVSDFERDFINKPLDKWCVKHNINTSKYGVCPEWEED